MPFLEAYLKAYGVNQYYEQVLKILAHIKNSEIKAYINSEYDWYEIDDAQDLDIANTIFAEEKNLIHKYEFHFGGYRRYLKLKDFCYLVNPYYPPQKMISQIKYFFNELLTQYPSGMTNQRLNASNMFEVDDKYLIVGNGASELINVLGKYVKGTITSFVPTFNEYIRCFINCEKNEIRIQEDNYRFNIERILENIENSDALLIINPDNPSGSFLDYENVIKIADVCQKNDILLIIDESFIDFAEKSKRYTLVKDDILEKYTNLVVIKSISKSYGIPGLRLGIMATSNGKIRKFMIDNMAIWNINSFAEYYLQIQRLYKKSYVLSCDNVVEQRNHLISGLSKNPYLEVYPSEANYVMCKIADNSPATADELSLELMKRYDILIKNLSSKKGFDGEQFIRIAVRDSADNELLLKAVNEILG